MLITKNSDYFFGVFWGAAFGGLNIFLHSKEIESMLIRRKYDITGNYITRYLVLAIGLFVAGFISFDWLLASIVGLFAYFPAIYIGSLINTIKL